MNVVIFGATSAIAIETARNFAPHGGRFALVGRNAERLETISLDLRARGAAECRAFIRDLSEISAHESLLREIWDAFGEVHVVLFAYGTLGDQKLAEQNFAEAHAILNNNFLSVASLLTYVANRTEAQGKGIIAVIGSVAGDRGRQSNYVYGAAKGALATFTAGLRNRLSKKGVAVVTIKPGFVDTPMTAHLKKGPLFASPAAVGKSIYHAIIKRRDIVYVPWFWRIIMGIIVAIPERAFKKLSL